MAWQTPKTNWNAADGVRDADFNRIEGNILQLYTDASERSDKTIYVSPTGNDASGTGTSNAPFATITKALSTVSKNLNGKAVMISVATGTYNEVVTIKGFDSPIVLTGGYNATASVLSLSIDGCCVYLDGLHIITSATQGFSVTNGGMLVGGGRITANNASSGVSASYGAVVALANITSNNATNYAISADTCSRVHGTTIAGTGNRNGLLVQGGAVVSYATDNLVATGTKTLTYGGGRIYTGSLGL